MSAHSFTEDQLVEQPAIGLLVLVPRLRAGLERLNPALTPESVVAAVDELTRDRSAQD